MAHPNQDGKAELDGNIQSEDFEVISPLGFVTDDQEKVPAFILKTRKARKFASKLQLDSDTVLEKLMTVDSVLSDPGLISEIENLGILLFKPALLQKLKLLVSYKTRVGIGREEYFLESLVYDSELKRRFKKLIMKRDGYLKDDENFIFMTDRDKLREGVNIHSLSNHRAILFLRNVDLDIVDVKKVLSIGLAFLLGCFSQAELLVKIKEVIPIGSYDVGIKYKENTFVLISIENVLPPLV